MDVTQTWITWVFNWAHHKRTNAHNNNNKKKKHNTRLLAIKQTRSPHFFPQNTSFHMINAVMLARVWSLWRVPKKKQGGRKHETILIWEVSLGLKPSWQKTNQCHILRREAPSRCLPEANYASRHTSGHFNSVCLISDIKTLPLYLKDRSSVIGVRRLISSYYIQFWNIKRWPNPSSKSLRKLTLMIFNYMLRGQPELILKRMENITKKKKSIMVELCFKDHELCVYKLLTAITGSSWKAFATN